MNNVDKYTPTILAIDDMPVNLDILVEHYQHDQVNLTVALCPLDGLKLAETLKPDLILLDIMMPVMDGYEVCSRLKSNPKTRHIPVIFVTAMSESSDEQKGLALGAVDYISKPFVMPILKARVRNHLELKRKTDLLAEMAFIDGLTGVANRRHFDQLFAREYKRHCRSGQPLSVIMIDVDYFKHYNDHYGHVMGDACLRIIANTLQKSLKRPADLLARYGGEEFVVLLPETDPKSALKIAQMLCRSIDDLQLPHQKSTCAANVTISLGCASSMHEHNDQCEDILSDADSNLYMAKLQGRNRVIGEPAQPMDMVKYAESSIRMFG
ncbi:MAG: diguanylate cyclase [Algicola sp.]|nr:diguanylate cyclase [Algicola sp.]